MAYRLDSHTVKQLAQLDAEREAAGVSLGLLLVWSFGFWMYACIPVWMYP